MEADDYQTILSAIVGIAERDGFGYLDCVGFEEIAAAVFIALARKTRGTQDDNQVEAGSPYQLPSSQDVPDR